MEYENIDEATAYRKACENVKKIVNAIKAIKIKYYPNFSRISDEDKKVYQELEANLEQISQEHDLDKLKTALMSEVSAKYDRMNINDEQGKQREPNAVDSRLLACYGAIDAQQKALSQGKLKQAIKCQEILEQYLEQIDTANYRDLIINYKREKFGELIREKEAVQEENKTWSCQMKTFCKPEDVEQRKKAMEQIEEGRKNSITLFNKIDTKEVKSVSGNTSKETDEMQVG